MVRILCDHELSTPSLLPDPSNDHVGVRPDCGICGRAMELGDKCVLLIGNEDSNAFYKAIRLDGFPAYDYRPESWDDIPLCRRPDCSDCHASREVSTAHADCHDFVESKYELDNHWSEPGRSHSDHLWVLSAWRTPWRQAPNFRLEEKTFTPNFSMFDKLGYPLMKMKSLPLEVIQIIHEFSAASPLWRLTAASALPHRLPAASSDQLLTIHLSTLLSWDRGCQPVIADVGDTTSRLPVIRMTIDAWGIKKVEQLPEQPRFTTWRTNTYIYVVLPRTHLRGIIARFKTWDTPTPPDRGECRFHPQNITDFTQFRTIELSKVTGITFFFADGKIFAIHPHTRETPCAQSTRQRLSFYTEKLVTWVYFPIPKNDSVAALGVRMLPTRGAYGDSPRLLVSLV
ncbi:hypothetical protein AUP68_06460 [Ilyonectria robusta]